MKQPKDLAADWASKLKPAAPAAPREPTPAPAASPAAAPPATEAAASTLPPVDYAALTPDPSRITGMSGQPTRASPALAWSDQVEGSSGLDDGGAAQLAQYASDYATGG